MNRFVFSCVFAIAAAAALIWNPGRAQNAAQAQAAGPAKAGAYYISEFEVTDPGRIRPYSAAVESTFRPYGGRYVVRGGKVASLEGAPTQRMVVIAFPSFERAQAWYDSEAYRALRPIRHQSANSRVFILEALPE